MSRFSATPEYRRLFMVKSMSLWLLCLTALVIGVIMPRLASAGLIMRTDTGSKTCFIDGADTGNAGYFEPDPGLPGDCSLQFIHFLSITVSQFGTITTSAQNLFVQGATLPMNGHTYMVSNSGQNYVFMDLFPGSGDITTLTCNRPTAAVSCAGLPVVDIPLFESLIGDTSLGAQERDIHRFRCGQSPGLSPALWSSPVWPAASTRSGDGSSGPTCTSQSDSCAR